MSDNYKIEKLPESLKYSKQLRVLNLYATGIENLPDWIGDFEHMEELILSINLNNSVEPNDTYIHFPSNLKVLKINACGLKEIPLGVFELESLMRLDLSNNPNLELTHDQNKWIDHLKLKGCKVMIDDKK